MLLEDYVKISLTFNNKVDSCVGFNHSSINQSVGDITSVCVVSFH